MNTATDTDLYMMVFADECKCTALHDRIRVACSGEVTHYRRLSCTGRAGLVCQNTATYMTQTIQVGYRCRDCLSLAADCWHVMPA